MKFLIHTKDTGISYSPEGEAAFNETYSKLLPEGRELPSLNIFSDAGYANCFRTMRSTSGSIIYWRSVPICWRTHIQGIRAYSTAEAEYIACSDTIVLSETNDFLDFFRPPPDKIVESSYGISPSLDNAILWLDSQSAIAIAQSEDTRPKSRHYALRWLRVRESASKLMFCPSCLQKADALSKLECSTAQRSLLLHHVTPNLDSLESEDSDSEFEEETFVTLGYCYLTCFGF